MMMEVICSESQQHFSETQGVEKGEAHGREATIWNAAEEKDEEHDPEFRVGQRFDHLSRFPMGVADTGVVDAHASNSDISFSDTEPLGSNWIRWQEKVDDESPSDGQ